MIKKLAIITTHPIQYYAPVFQLMAKELDLKVFYTWGKASVNKFDTGFKKQVEWDLPLLEGYDSKFVENISKDQGTHHFYGIVNPHLIDTLQSYKPDAILVYGWAWKSHLKTIRYFKGKIPIYFRGDSTLLNHQSGLRSILKKIFLQWVYRHIELAFYVGKQNKAYFKKYGFLEKQLVFAPHAIDNERFEENRRVDAVSLRAKLGINPHEVLIVFAGKFDPVKNPELLLDAFIDLDLKNTHLLIVGNGVLEEALKGKVGPFDYVQDDNGGSLELGVESWEKKVKRRIHFMDFQNQTAMPVVYQACDLFCLPSLSETWGLAVNEAMAAGKAVLVSNKVGCAADLVKAGVNGAVFRSGDLADLKQKLNALTENKDKLAQMGLASQQIIKDWSFEKQVKVIVDTIRNKHAK